MMPVWLKGLPWKIVGVALLIFAIIVFFSIRSCQQNRQAEAEIGLHKGQQGALTNSAADAVNTQGAANARERTSEELSRSNEKEIRNAEGANDRVNPAARDAGLRALCRRAAYRDTERCGVFRPPAP